MDLTNCKDVSRSKDIASRIPTCVNKGIAIEEKNYLLAIAIPTFPLVEDDAFLCSNISNYFLPSSIKVEVLTIA